jgi:hypothetical protein
MPITASQVQFRYEKRFCSGTTGQTTGAAPHSGCVGPNHSLLSWEGAASGCLTVAPNFG